MEMNKYCADCFYYRRVHCENVWCCNYIFIEDKMRPCEPGEKCTVKIPIKVYRKKRKKEDKA